MGASYSLQYSHSIDMISDSITCFQQILKDLFMMCEIDSRESDARTM
jgi:hypothetical protein